MKKIKIYGLSLALALLLLLAVTPCAQAADMSVHSNYVAGYLHTNDCDVYAIAYVSSDGTVRASLTLMGWSAPSDMLIMEVTVCYPDGTVASDHSIGGSWAYQGFPAVGVRASTLLSSPPAGGYVHFDIASWFIWEESVWGPIWIGTGSDSYKWYYPSGGGGGGGCPFLQVWDGSHYADEGLLNIHNAQGVDVTYEHALTAVPEPVHGAYEFRLTEHPQTISDIDQVQLHAILEDGTIEELPLKKAWHSEDGNVRNLLLKSDDRRVEEIGADHNGGTSQSIDLKFAALEPNAEAIAFIFTIEGNNMITKT
jgi:hypothetical protein